MNAIINGTNVTFEAGETILAVAGRYGFFIPSLCAFQPMDHKPGVCRVCLVSCTPPSGNPCLVPACVTPMEEGMRVETSTPEIRAHQRMQVELLLAEHHLACETCARHGDCELQQLKETLGIDTSAPQGEARPAQVLHGITRDMDKCVRCLRCVTVCRRQGAKALRADSSGQNPEIIELTEASCIQCGQCTRVCPVGAIAERDDSAAALEVLTSTDAFPVVAFSGFVHDALKRVFSSSCADLEGRLAACLRHLGARVVVNADIVAGALASTMSEELRTRLAEGRALPLFSAACPAWVNYAQTRLPGIDSLLSSARVPEALAASLNRNALSRRYGVAEERIRLILVSPCTAMKQEADVVLSARDLARLMNLGGLCPDDVAAESFDAFPQPDDAHGCVGHCGELTKAVMRGLGANIRLEGLPEACRAVPGDHDLLESTVDLGALGVVKTALCFNCATAATLAAQALEGRSPYAFVEVLACPGGCAQGGGSERF